MPFNDWLVCNEVVFTSPYSTIDGERYWPFFNVLHSLPENRKSQFLYLRPDLGTTVYRFDDLQTLGAHLDIELPRTHETGTEPVPALNDAADDHIRRFFAWTIWKPAERRRPRPWRCGGLSGASRRDENCGSIRRDWRRLFRSAGCQSLG
jgi:hypothetical protein